MLKKSNELHNECLTCKLLLDTTGIKYCLIYQQMDYLEILKICPCKQCIIKVTCTVVCANRLLVWSSFERVEYKKARDRIGGITDVK
jgi:hypothetical protein